MERTFFHRPVLVPEVLRLLQVTPGGRYIDATAGEGGHASAILEAALPGGYLLGLDLDSQVLEVARARLNTRRGSFILVHDSYTNVAQVASETGFGPADGILLDLGLSSFQLEASGRGFTFQKDEPLDMRFDSSVGPPAAELVNSHSSDQLARILRDYGEERRAGAIARAIVQHRPLATTFELANLVARTVGRRGRTNPATRTFQALRIAVNGELQHLESGLASALDALKPGGWLAVIGYHSLEDRLVKQYFVRESRNCICPPRTPICVCGHRATVRVITRRPERPSSSEIETNPRGRSARLRVVERISPDEGQ